MERNNSHHKTIVLLKRNVNFLLTGTVDGEIQEWWPYYKHRTFLYNFYDETGTIHYTNNQRSKTWSA